MRCTRQLRLNLFLHFAEQHRLWLIDCSLIHTIPAPQQWSVVCRGHSLVHMIPAQHQRSAVCRGHSLIHMIPAPHQRLPCLEDTGLLFTRYQPRISGCRV